MKTTTLRTLVASALVWLPLVVTAQETVPPWSGYAVVDMSHSFGADTIYWPTEDGFRLEVGFEGIADGGYYYASNRFAAADHGGTHLDAPRHFAEHGQAADEVPLDRLIGPACVIDVAAAARGDPDYLLGVADIEAWEARHGAIEAGCIVVLDTGFARYWPNRERYMGTALRGEEGVANLHFPGYSEDSAVLLARRGVAAVGIDTPSIDYGQSKDFRVHRYLYERNVPGLENLANVDALPPKGAYVIALPMKIEGGSGAPLRVIAFVPE